MRYYFFKVRLQSHFNKVALKKWADIVAINYLDTYHHDTLNKDSVNIVTHINIVIYINIVMLMHNLHIIRVHIRIS